MLRSHSRRPVLFFMLAAVAACSDQPTASSVSPLPPGAPRLDIIVDHMSEDSTSADFTVTPTGGTFIIGPHAIKFPANSICNPATSSYGVEFWDAPCEPLTEPIQIHAEVRNLDGRAWVDFTPSLRFVPTSDSEQFVWILMKSEAAKTSTDINTFGILWAPAIGAEGVDEAAQDPSMVTYLWREGGIVFRRIKHFSGYNVRDFAGGMYTVESEVTPVMF